MKIAILGAGSGACLTAAYLRRYHKTHCEIEIYHTKTVPPEPVGQAALLLATNLFFETYGWDWYNNPVKAVFKTGASYEGWGHKKEEFFHPFPMESAGIHFIPQFLSEFTLNCGYYKVHEKYISDPEEEIDADWIYDCRGRSEIDYDDYIPLTNPINSAIVGRTNEPDPKLTWTRSIATPDGWAFGIPNHDSVSYGYLYNNTVTDKETATKNFKEQFGLDVIHSFSFRNYKAKSIWKGDKTILNGNKYAFVEPLEASSMAMYQMIADRSSRHIFDGDSKETIQTSIDNDVAGIENFLLWHYNFGSKYDTPFWRFAKKMCDEFDWHEDFGQAIEYADQHDNTYLYDNPIQVAQWASYNFKNWIDNMGAKY